MQHFTHIVTTRFNVPTENWQETRDGKKALSEEWLSDRFAIFEDYCLPSFSNQSEKDFKWLVFFDEETPEKYLNKITAFSKLCANFTPVYVKNFGEMRQYLLDTVSRMSTPYIISTDIDNDDMLHRDFVKNIQKLFRPVNNYVIDLRRGYQLQKLSGNEAAVNELYMVANAFVSLVEKTSQAETVIKDKHLNYRNYPEGSAYDASPMFIQYIHQFNLVNEVYENNKRLPAINQGEFGITTAKAFHIAPLSAALHNTKRRFWQIKNLFTK